MESHRAFMSVGRHSTLGGIPSTTADIHTSRRWSRDANMENRMFSSLANRRSSIRSESAHAPSRVPRCSSAMSTTSSSSNVSGTSTSGRRGMYVERASTTTSVDSQPTTLTTESVESVGTRRKRDDVLRILSSPKTLKMVSKVLVYMGNSVPQTSPYTETPFKDWSVRPGMQAQPPRRY